jgi:hypothetical protein
MGLHTSRAPAKAILAQPAPTGVRGTQAAAAPTPRTFPSTQGRPCPHTSPCSLPGSIIFGFHMRRIKIFGMAVFGLFPVVLGLGLTWLYAYIATVAGAYDNSPPETQARRRCSAPPARSPPAPATQPAACCQPLHKLAGRVPRLLGRPPPRCRPAPSLPPWHSPSPPHSLNPFPLLLSTLSLCFFRFLCSAAEVLHH